MIETIPINTSLSEHSRIQELDVNNIQFGRLYSDHMFIADYRDGQWMDCRIEPYDRLAFSPAISVLHYGQSIFEGLKAYASADGGVLVFRPHDNFLRMNKSAVRMCMPELPEEIFMGGLLELLKIDKAWVPRKPGASLYIRPFMFATDEYIGVRPSDSYRFMIFTSPAGAYYSEPVKMKVEKQYSRAFPGGTGAAKAAGNYGASLYPALQAQKQGYHQLIWTDGMEHKYIEEAGTMNIMFVINNILVTSPTSDTILSGITRRSVLQLAQDKGYQVEERKISVDEVIESIEQGRLQEAFGTGTAATIAPISLINHDGKDYALPVLDDQSFSHKVLKALNDIKSGQTEDVHGWNTKVP